MDTVFDSQANIPLTENSIKQLHVRLLRHFTKDETHRGEYKKLPNNVEAFGPWLIFFLRSLKKQKKGAMPLLFKNSDRILARSEIRIFACRNYPPIFNNATISV